MCRAPAPELPQPELPEPLAPPYDLQLLPPGQLTLLIGEPGVGKSLLAIDLAARLSRGDPLPLLSPPSPDAPWPSCPAATTICGSREDSLNILEARALAARRDNSLLRFVPHDQLDLVPKLKRGNSTLVRTLRICLPELPNFRLLILDPLPAFLGQQDCSHQSTVRALLRPLLELAREHQFAILGISHLNKSRQSKTPLHRCIGSLAYTALARTVLLVTPDAAAPAFTPSSDPNSRSRQRRKLLIPLKSNLTDQPVAYAFTIESGPAIHWDQNPITDHPLLNRQGEFDDPFDADPVANTSLGFARDFLLTTLAHGPVPSTDLLKQARALGIANRTLARARVLLNIQNFHGGHGNPWFTSLPQDRPLPAAPEPSPTTLPQ